MRQHAERRIDVQRRAATHTWAVAVGHGQTQSAAHGLILAWASAHSRAQMRRQLRRTQGQLRRMFSSEWFLQWTSDQQ